MFESLYILFQNFILIWLLICNLFDYNEIVLLLSYITFDYYYEHHFMVTWIKSFPILFFCVFIFGVTTIVHDKHAIIANFFARSLLAIVDLNDDLLPDWCQTLISTMLAYCLMDLWEQILVKFESYHIIYHWWKSISNCYLHTGDNLVSSIIC